jgi:hypothetical protein
MQQHPVPQHISSYEFKLVGDMTLKQFFQLAGGVVVSLLIYASPLPGYVKWPGVLIFAAIGAALAFLPFEERPLSTWFFAFIRAIYSPTIYTYVANSQEEVFAKGSSTLSSPGIATPLGQQKAEEYLKAVPHSGLYETFEQAEKSFFQRVGHMFQNVTPARPGSTTAPAQGITQAPPRVEEISMQIPKPEVLTVPAQQSVQVEKPQLPPTPTVAAQTGPQAPLQSVFNQQGAQPLTTSQAVFTPEAAPPAPPEIPNTIVGQVISAEGKIVEGAILEIRDSSKKPVRAVRTNRVGHFITATPLQNGDYEIETEKPGFTFETVHFKAEGTLIPPIQIKAKA